MITVVTKNKNKVSEISSFFSGIVDISHINLDCIEPQANTVEEIASYKAKYAYEKLKTPVIVDDTGLFIDILSGFPGPYASYVQYTIGNKGILQIMNGIENRHAYFKTAIAYVDSSGVFVFTGQLDGEISHTEHGSNGFGYDPIFSVCDGKTLSDLTINEKNCISHRARALFAFKSWYMSHKLS